MAISIDNETMIRCAMGQHSWCQDYKGRRQRAEQARLHGNSSHRLFRSVTRGRCAVKERSEM